MALSLQADPTDSTQLSHEFFVKQESNFRCLSSGNEGAQLHHMISFSSK